jgi:RND family efflux transporter MFP subunit
MSQLLDDLASLRIERTGGAPARTAAVAAVPRAGRKPLRWVAPLLALGSLVSGILAYRALEPRLFGLELTFTEVSWVSPTHATTKLTATGFVVAQVTSRVGAPVPGKVLRVHVREGDSVKAGDLLVELDDSEQRSALAAARARTAAAAARVELARADSDALALRHSRARTLVEAGAAQRAELEDLDGQAASLRRSVRVAEAELAASRAAEAPLQIAQDSRRVLAPLDGTVIGKPVAAGELVDSNAPVAELADFGTLAVEADVPEARVAQLGDNSPCEVTLDAVPGKRLRGVVSGTAKRVDRAKATLTVRIKLLDAAVALPGMAGRISFLSEPVSDRALQAKPKLVVPTGAVLQRPEGPLLATVQAGTVKLVRVRTGERVGAGLELLEGPPAGTRILASPPATLEDGQPVKEKGG